jgi:tetratricopeptide (TPR) repeat protein
MRSQPESARADSIAEACTGIGEWAEDNGLTNTAVYFLELAAWAAPDDPLLALTAGRANRRSALYERARHWFERGIDVARAQENRPAQAAGHLSWGNMEFQRGRHRLAHRYFLRAWRIARKFHLREEGGAARHNMMTLALELGRFDDAQEHALAAYRFYGRKHGRMPYFAHDVAQLWSWQGFYTAAVPIFRAVMPLIDRPKERIKVLANLGRAAAAMGDVDTFFEAWRGVAAYVPEPNEHLAEAYVNIGEGAMMLGLSAQAQDVAARALSLARARGERSTEAQAEALTNAIRAPAPAKRPPREVPDTVKALSSWLLKALEDHAAPSK